MLMAGSTFQTKVTVSSRAKPSHRTSLSDYSVKYDALVTRAEGKRSNHTRRGTRFTSRPVAADPIARNDRIDRPLVSDREETFPEPTPIFTRVTAEAPTSRF
jgi:hypothetical protein